MINGDYIRAMDNDRLSRFLMMWNINFFYIVFGVRVYKDDEC